MTEENTIIVDGRTSPKTIYKKRTSPKTIQIQASKTVRSKAEWLWISTSDEDGEGKGTYDVGQREMKRERLHELKPKRKARYEKSLIVRTPPKGKLNARGVFKPTSKRGPRAEMS